MGRDGIMSVVAFREDEIFSDSICVDGEYQFSARKVFSKEKTGGGYLVAFFTGSLGLGCGIVQAVFENYEHLEYQDRYSFGTGLNIKDDITISMYVIDKPNNIMFVFDVRTESFSRIPIQDVSLGFDTAVALVEHSKLDGESWEQIASKLDRLSNAQSSNARYVAPPYYVLNVLTGQERTINHAP